jgi:hypothetical protein
MHHSKLWRNNSAFHNTFSNNEMYGLRQHEFCPMFGVMHVYLCIYIVLFWLMILSQWNLNAKNQKRVVSK